MSSKVETPDNQASSPSRPTAQNTGATKKQPHPTRLKPGPPTARGVRQLQQTIGNQAVGRLLSSPQQSATPNNSAPLVQRKPNGDTDPAKSTPYVEPSPAWNALQNEFEKQMSILLKLNGAKGLIGERTDLIMELHVLWAQIGAPGEKSDSELAQLRARLRVFEKARAEERDVALQNWKVMEEEYQLERQRLANSQELSDQKALEYLDSSYQMAKDRKATAGRYLRFDDIAFFGFDMANETHVRKGWETALRETIAVTPKENDEALTTWPWPEFKGTQLVIESGAETLHKMSDQIDSAIKYQIRRATLTMQELGETKAATDSWAKAAYARARESADELVHKIPLSGQGAHKWAHRLHIAGRLTIVVDVGVSLIDIWASPPKERPKKIFIQASRIAGGVAGVSVGAGVGFRAGRIFGPKGAAAGSFLGGLVGGFVGALTAKKIAASIADELWPPEDTYIDAVPQ